MSMYHMRSQTTMISPTRWALIPALLIGWLVAVHSVRALDPEVKDAAGFFSPDVVKEANAEIKGIKQRHKKDLLIETFETVPMNRRKQVQTLKGEAREKVFIDWRRERMEQAKVNGIYILICKEPPHLQI